MFDGTEEFLGYCCHCGVPVFDDDVEWDLDCVYHVGCF